MSQTNHYISNKQQQTNAQKLQQNTSSQPPVQIKQNSNPKIQQQQQKNIEQVPVQQIKLEQHEQDQEQDQQKCLQVNPQKANEYKNKGNQLFKQKKCSQAILQYREGLNYTDDKNLRAILYSNIAVCFIKEEDYEFAKKYCKKVLKQNPNHRKARMNLARCYEQQKKIQQAYEEYKKCEQDIQKNIEGTPISPQDKTFIKDKITYLKPKIDELNESRKKQVFDGLKNIGNSILGYFGMSLDNFKLEQGPGGGYNISFKQ